MAAPPALSKAARSDFAVLIPAYNEVDVVPELLRELRATFESHDLSGEVLLVDDGSTDDTGAVAEREGADWPLFRVLRHRRNQGKTEAMVTGAAATDRSVLVLFDADLQHAPDDIPRFLAKVDEGWDMVTGRKVGTYAKRRVSSIYNRLSRWIFRVPVSDMNSIKAFHREILDEITLRHDWHRYLVVLAHARGFSITEIDSELHARRAGESKFQGPFRVLVGVMDMISVWFLLQFSRKPLLLFGGAGATLIALGGLVGIVAFFLRFGMGQGFRPLLYLVILLVTVGVVLLLSGLNAELVAQLRSEVDRLKRGDVGKR